jgi:hypothetical protein
MTEADVYITVRPGTTVHIRAEAAEDTTAPADKAPQVRRNYPDTVAAAVLDRLERFGSPHVREAHDELMKMGYLMYPSVPRNPNGQPQSYLRIHDPNRPGPAVGYLAPQNISFTLDREQLKNEPGGEVVPSTGEVAFSHASPASLARGLEVARKLKR